MGEQKPYINPAYVRESQAEIVRVKIEQLKKNNTLSPLQKYRLIEKYECKLTELTTV